MAERLIFRIICWEEVLKMKKLTVLFAILLAISLSAGLQASAKDIYTPLSLDGAPLDSQAVVSGETVYLPVRSVCEALGYEVTWQNQNGVKTVAVQKDADSVVLDLTNQQIQDNGHRYYAPGGPEGGIELMDGRTYLDSALFDPLFAVCSKYDAKENRVALQRIYENGLTIATEKTESQENLLKLTLQYPQISGLPDAKVQDSINSVMKQAALNAEAEGRKNAEDMKHWIADGYTGGVTQCETYFDYAIEYNQNGLLSIVFKNYQYAGGAHGSTIQSSYTFDLATGKDLSLADLMTSGSGYNASINAAIRTEIDSRIQSGGLVEFDPGFTDIGNDPPYYVSNSGLVFYFQQYEYFPYAAGIQEFNIPYNSLKSMLKPEYRFFYSAPVMLDAEKTNPLSVGDIGRVTLAGNPTTGYTWHCEISDQAVMTQVSGSYTADEANGLVGVGGTYLWSFKAQKAGNATITFRYYRDWEGPQAAAQTVAYKITVS